MPSTLMSKLSATATQMIRTDHAAVLALFHKIRPDAGDSQRAAALRGICTALEIHAQLEEEIFYPALRESGIQSPVLDKSVPEHDEIRRLIERVRSTEGERTEQDNAALDLMNVVLHHVADEETRLLPEAERVLGESRNSELGAEMTARRLELMKPQAGQLIADKARAMPATTAMLALGSLVVGALLLGGRRSRRVMRPIGRGTAPLPWQRYVRLLK